MRAHGMSYYSLYAAIAIDTLPDQWFYYGRYVEDIQMEVVPTHKWIHSSVRSSVFLNLPQLIRFPCCSTKTLRTLALPFALHL